MAVSSPTLRILALLLVLPWGLHGQEEAAPPVQRTTPFTVFIDLQKRAQKRGDWPFWMDAVEYHDSFDADGRPVERTVRLRFRRDPADNKFLLVRFQFLDRPGASPMMTAWSEGGDCIFESGAIGSGTGLNRMERITLPMRGVDYIDILVEGAGDNLRSVQLVSMGAAAVLAPLDFADRIPLTIDPFAPPTDEELPATSDEALLGRVSAKLLDREVLLRPEEGGAALEFELEGPPLLAVLRVKLMNADPAHPPRVALNNTPLGPLSLRVPDLADPGFRGTMRALKRGVTIRYTGWMAAEIAIPGEFLKGGVNRIDLQLQLADEPLVIRDAELQLKYNDPTFDYDLSLPIP